jgi:hypothetical protein
VSRNDLAPPCGTTLLDVPEGPFESPTPVPADKDPLAKPFCRTLAEVGEREYGVVIVGGGAVGAALLEHLVRQKDRLRLPFRVLVLEKGGALLPEHVQNLDPAYRRLVREAVVWPWMLDPDHQDYDLTPQIPHLGGRAQFWSTWIPRPSRRQLRDWPQEVVRELDGYWPSAEAFLGGVLPGQLGPEMVHLQRALRERLVARLFDLPHFHRDIQESGFEVRLAAGATLSRLGYRKFSPVPTLVALAARADVDIVTGCEVTSIEHAELDGGGGRRRATVLHTAQGRLELGPQTELVLANGIVEATGLVLDSFAGVVSPDAGTNLAGHAASWFAARVPRAVWERDAAGERLRLAERGLQVGCLYLRGSVRDARLLPEERDFHIQLMAASNPSTCAARRAAVADLYRLIPDSFDPEFLRALSDDRHIGFLVHCLGEWRGRPGDGDGSRVTVDKEGWAVLRIAPSEVDLRLRGLMDQAAQELTRRVLADGGLVEYWHPGREGLPGGWRTEPPAGRLKKLLLHESGTLWMGTDPATSVTAPSCRLHGTQNVWIGGAATFPGGGSWNPTLTAVAMAQRLADHLTRGPARP